MADNTGFLNSLKIGSKVAVFEGYIEDDALTEVTSFTGMYIQVMRHPELKFDRQTGKQAPRKKGDRTYRYLFPPAEWQARINDKEWKEELYDILIESTLTLEKYKQCREALEQILKD